MTRARTFLGMATSVHAISGNIQFGTCPIQIIVTLGHVISGQARFGTAQLHNLKLLCTDCSHGKSVQAPIRLKFVTVNPVYDCLGRLATASERLVRLISFHIRGWAIIIDIRAPNRTEAIEDVMRMCKLIANIPSWQLRERLLSAVRTRPGRTTDMRPLWSLHPGYSGLSEVNGVRRTRHYLEDRLKTQEADASGEFVDIISRRKGNVNSFNMIRNLIYSAKHCCRLVWYFVKCVDVQNTSKIKDF